MKIKKAIGVAATLVLAGGLSLVGAQVASAHVPVESITCSLASVSLTAYDEGATATVIVDGTTEHTGTFGGSYVATFPLTSDASHVSHRLQVTVVSGQSQYNVNYDQTVTGCYVPPTPPPAPPTPPVGVACVATVTPYHESDDNAAVLTADGWQFTNKGDGKPVDLGFVASGNLQGFTSLTWNASNVVGNGIFFRFVIDLTGDGGSAYNSLSITDSTVTQSSVANVGSKSVFLGKSLAQIAAAYPHNQIKAIFWQTGSSYPAGDGALLTAAHGACINASFVTGSTPPPSSDPTPPTHVQTGDVSPLAPWLGVFVLALIGGAALVTRRTATK